MKERPCGGASRGRHHTVQRRQGSYRHSYLRLRPEESRHRYRTMMISRCGLSALRSSGRRWHDISLAQSLLLRGVWSSAGASPRDLADLEDKVLGALKSGAVDPVLNKDVVSLGSEVSPFLIRLSMTSLSGCRFVCRRCSIRRLEMFKIKYRE